jgi:hypothetical protein
MTEIIALVPTMAALAGLVIRGLKPSTSFLTGCLLSVATLIRTNLGCLGFVVGLLFVCSETSNGFVSLLKRTGAYVLGGSCPWQSYFRPTS